MHAQVNAYLANLTKWQDEIKLLRIIVQDTGLKEDYKWMHPCYTYNQKNIVLIQEFKEYCALLFHKGVLLKDSNNLLVQQTKNVQAARQLRFTSTQEIKNLEAIIKAYIYEAVTIEKAGLKIKKKNSKSYLLPEELTNKFKKDPQLKTAFYNLTPGRQKGYIIFFNKAKQSKTRTSRIEKYTQRIVQGFGIHDCICGHSKRMPTCDGSHKDT